MGFGAVLRERFPFIKFLVNAQKTIWYPILFAVLSVISGSNGYKVYLPIMFVLCSFLMFSIIFADDNKVFFVPLLMIYYSLGMDNSKATPGAGNDSLISSFEPSAINHIIVFGIVCVIALIARLIADGSIKSAIKNRTPGLIGILVLDAVFLINGLFSPTYKPINLLYGAIIAVSFTVFYLIATGLVSKSKDFIPFICKTMVCTAYVALVQIVIKAYGLHQTGNLFHIDVVTGLPIIARSSLSLAWGLATIISAVFVLGIPAALYLAKNCRFCILSYISALLFLAGAVLINTRSALLVGAVAFIVCAFVCCFKNKKRSSNAMICRIMFLLILLAAGYAAAKLLSDPELIQKILSFFRFDMFHDSGDMLRDSGRIEIWTGGWQDFLKNPVLGSGFDTGSNIDKNVFSNMYHCILIQFLGSMGVVGALAFITHLVFFAKTFFKKFSIDKILILFIPLMILGMSLVDNFFFYPNFQIFYCVFIAVAEYMAYNKNNALTLESQDISTNIDTI